MNKSMLLILSLYLVCTSCKKTAALNTATLLEQYFETDVINRNFIVTLAKDSSADLTSNYNGYVFVLLKTDLYHGPLQATKSGTIYTGTWDCNSDYSKLTISLPSPPADFGFLNRAWRFKSKNLPTLQLAPWGSTDSLLLHMYRQ
ncbi:MAG: hypothetical protein M3139_10635 [Bacteroidota bacterium]|nr:hypothetical protein [Bacteroidota bacterium]